MAALTLDWSAVKHTLSIWSVATSDFVVGKMNPEPGSNAPPKDRRTVIGLVIAAILMAGIAYGVFQAAKRVSGGSREAIAVGDKFLALLGKHDFESAADLFANEAKATTTTKELEKIQSVIEDQAGKNVQHGTSTWQYNVNNGASSVTLVYPMEGSSGTGTITLVVVKTDYGWQIYNYDYSLH